MSNIYSQDAEQSYLGGLISNPSEVKRKANLSEKDFFIEFHKIIFRTVNSLINSGIPVDIVSISEEVSKTSRDINLKAFKTYLIELHKQTVYVSGNETYYAKIIKEYAFKRRVVNLLKEGVGKAEGENNLSEFLYNIEADIHALASAMEAKEEKVGLLKDHISELLIDFEERINSGNSLSGISSGFKYLDEITSGLKNDDLIIIAGRPSMGKTTLAMNILENVGQSGKYSGFFSLEMGEQSIIKRSISSFGKIPLQNVLSAQFNQDDWTRVNKALKKIHNSKIFIHHTYDAKVSSIRSIARKMDSDAKKMQRENGEEEEGLSILAVDYIQQIEGEKGENRNAELGYISRSLKSLAVELKIPVIAVSQLSRTVESRTNKRPIMSDLRDSGAIEQDADLITFIYRDEVYNPKSKDKGLAEIIIGKQRNGPLGNIKLVFNGQFSRFDNFYDPGN